MAMWSGARTPRARRRDSDCAVILFAPMGRRPYRVPAAVVLAAWMASACGGRESGPTTPTGQGTGPGAGFPSGTLTLKTSPIDQNAILWITPLGNLNPPAHTLPTDHIYFYFANPDRGDSPAGKRTAFFAPGDGTVTTLLGGLGAESKVFVRQTATFTYYLDHLIPTVPLTAGTKVTAGQMIGTTGDAYAVDLGVINESLTRGFLTPSRYLGDTLHADAPLKYFDEPLRGQLYARVQRLGSDLDGRIDYDMPGRLAGNWFATPGDTDPLVFVYDTYDPSKVLIAGASGDMRGVYSVGAGDPAPADVSVGSGKVRYALTVSNSGTPHGNAGTDYYLLVQMVDDTHIKAERFPPVPPPSDFTAAARTFSR